jgi:hypothetical protein
MRRSTKTITTAVVGVLVAAAPASAQINPTVGSYSAPAATIQTTVTPQSGTQPSITSSPGGPTTPSTPTKAAATTSSKKALPFTGLQVGLVLLAGAALLGTGLGVRRLVRAPHTS